MEMVKFLISQGADMKRWSDEADLLCRITRNRQFFQNYEKSRLPLLRAILEHDEDLCVLDDLGWNCLKHATHCSTEEFLFLQRNICPSFYQAPQWKRNSIIKAYLNFHNHGGLLLSDTYSVVRAILRGVSFAVCPPEFKSYAEFLAHYGSEKLPTMIAHDIGYFRRAKKILNSHDAFHKAQKSFRIILNDFLAGGFDINEVDDAGSHLLIAFCHGYLDFFPPKWSNKTLNNDLRWWLKELHNMGVNLRSLGKSGERSFKTSGGPRDYHFKSALGYTAVRLLGFSHGKTPEDWTLWVSQYSDVFSGDFWQMIERRMEIPGGWSSDIHLFLQ